MRINKYIASSGMCSRRKAEEFIVQGLVTVNGIKAELSTMVEEGDTVLLNGKAVTPKKEHVVLLFNKPVGVTCTTELHVKGNIISYINYPERIFPVGRLDKDSQGLILLTNDGDLVNECLRVENGHEKEYIVRVDKPVTPQFIKKMSEGVEIYNPVTDSKVVTLPCKVTKLGEKTFRIVLKQGYNRQIRRMCNAFSYNVTSLKRVRFMFLNLDVKPGEYRLLTEKEMEKLKSEANKNVNVQQL